MRPVKTFYKICYYVTVELDAQTFRATAYLHSCTTHFHTFCTQININKTQAVSTQCMARNLRNDQFSGVEFTPIQGKERAKFCPQIFARLYFIVFPVLYLIYTLSHFQFQRQDKDYITGQSVPIPHAPKSALIVHIG